MILKPEAVPSDITLKDLHSVGRYAIAPTFSDGHRSGIYHFDRLKALVEKTPIKSK